MFKINQVFNNHSGLKPLLQEAEHHQRLQQLWSLAAPEFSAHTQVIGLDHETLIVGAYSGAIANRIRLLCPSLLARAQEICQKSRQIKGLNLNAIKVKVQVKSPTPVKRKQIKPPSGKALNTLETCAEHIENPALQAALRQFIRHQR